MAVETFDHKHILSLKLIKNLRNPLRLASRSRQLKLGVVIMFTLSRLNITLLSKAHPQV